MEAVAEKKKRVNHGKNLRIARTCQNVTQEDLAFRVNMSQSKVSALELEEVIEDSLLDTFALALDVPVGFLKNFIPEEAMNIYNVNNTETYEMTQTNSDNAMGNDVVQQKVIENQENIFYPIDKVSELYERLLKEKDLQIEELKSQLK